MRRFSAIASALADTNRARMLMALRGGELCLCEIVALVALAPSTTSKHMSILRQAHLVEGRKQGRWMYYRLADDGAPTVVQQALEWLQDSLTGDARIARDVKRLKEIVRVNRPTGNEQGCIKGARARLPKTACTRRRR